MSGLSVQKLAFSTYMKVGNSTGSTIQTLRRRDVSVARK